MAAAIASTAARAIGASDNAAVSIRYSATAAACGPGRIGREQLLGGARQLLGVVPIERGSQRRREPGSGQLLRASRIDPHDRELGNRADMRRGLRVTGELSRRGSDDRVPQRTSALTTLCCHTGGARSAGGGASSSSRSAGSAACRSRSDACHT